MALGDVMRREHRPRRVEAVVGDGGGTAVACDSQNTKLAELTFHAVLGGGSRELRFGRALTR
jgi:hypothetical protein